MKSADAKVDALKESFDKLKESAKSEIDSMNKVIEEHEESDVASTGIIWSRYSSIITPTWAKEDLLREQNNELANFRRERENVEAERSHLLKQIHDLQEHIQDKERNAMEWQEQHRIAQETILYKDEQLREAQTWIARVQEMDVLQSNTNQSLQAELRECTEQYNQQWLGCQRQKSTIPLRLQGLCGKNRNQALLHKSFHVPDNRLSYKHRPYNLSSRRYNRHIFATVESKAGTWEDL